jgi:hypothetical protein
MTYTPLANLTDEELLQAVYHKKEATDHELELTERLDYALTYIDTLLEELGRPKPASNVRYKEEAAA